MYNFDLDNINDKNKFYKTVLEYAHHLMDGETDCTANLANLSALLNQALKEINWVGFYITRGNQLVLGPFQGKAACIRIDKGRGVCGAAFEHGKTQLVKDVHQFAGHIACDSDTNSEIVVPITCNNKVVAVLDIDSPKKNRFDEIDKEHLETLCQMISSACDWARI